MLLKVVKIGLKMMIKSCQNMGQTVEEFVSEMAGRGEGGRGTCLMTSLSVNSNKGLSLGEMSYLQRL